MKTFEKNVVVGTAGHIDHGKTSLVKALTGIDTDRLKEEKERGITIDIGFAKLLLPSGIQISIVDVPGHERFIKNMVAGATGIDLVILVIAADEGIMPQTKEHLEICELLGIKEGLVVLTKADLVDNEWLEMLKAEVEEFLKNTFLEGAPIIPFSAITLQGKDEIIKALDKKTQEIKSKEVDLPFRLPIDGIFTIKGFGLVVRGTAISGEVNLNEELMLYPHIKKIKVRNIQVHGVPVERAKAGTRVALNIVGAEKEEIYRGAVISEPYVLKPSHWLDVEIKTLKNIEPPLKNFENLLLYIGTAEVFGKIILFNKEYLNPGERDIAQFFSNSPICAWRGDKFILRRPGTNETIAGGTILDPIASRRKRTKPWERKELEFLAKTTEEELILYLVKKKRIQGITIKDLSLHTSIFGKKLENFLEKLKEEFIQLKSGEESNIFPKEAFLELKREIIEKLNKFHENHPYSPGLSKELLKSRLSTDLKDLLLDLALEELVREQKIVKEKELYSLVDFKNKSTEYEVIKKEVENKFLKEGLTPRNYEEIINEFGKLHKAAEEVLKNLLREGILVKVSEKIIYHKKTLEEIERKVRNYFKNNPELSIGDFRKLVGQEVSRKYLIPLLEYLDKQKITLRLGDKRILRKG